MDVANMLYRVLFLCALLSVVSAGSLRPSPTFRKSRPSASLSWPSASASAWRARRAAKPTPTVSPPLCKSGPVQCCVTVEGAKSTLASAALVVLGITLPTHEEVGINCVSLTDEEVQSGFCDDSVICCSHVYSGVGIGCTDVAVAPAFH